MIIPAGDGETIGETFTAFGSAEMEERMGGGRRLEHGDHVDAAAAVVVVLAAAALAVLEILRHGVGV